MSPREARVTRNEALFREVNIRIANLEEGSLSRGEGALLALVCECAHTGCTTPIEADRATFEQVRQNPLRFMVTPGHEDLETESVVERQAGCLIVEKHSAS
jgi:hypothetical protein